MPLTLRYGLQNFNLEISEAEHAEFERKLSNQDLATIYGEYYRRIQAVYPSPLKDWKAPEDPTTTIRDIISELRRFEFYLFSTWQGLTEILLSEARPLMPELGKKGQ